MLDQRKNFRFPAFDDETGVKLPKKNPRRLFEEPVSEGEPQLKDPLETLSNRHNQPSRRHTEAPKRYNEPQKKQSILNKKERTPFHQTTLPKKNSLVDEHKTRSASTPAQKAAVISNYQGRSHFVPKHIPASVIQEKPQPRFTKEEILNALKKEKDGYLLLEDPLATAFENRQRVEKQPLEVKRERPIPVTRQQFKKIKTDGTYSEDELERLLPKTRRELQQAKARNTTAYGKKKEAAERQQRNRNSRLEKSLAGIMAENDQPIQGSQYFKN